MATKKKYYWFKSLGHTPSYSRVMYAYNANDATRMFYFEYFKKFGIYPVDYSRERTDKNIADIINDPDYYNPTPHEASGVQDTEAPEYIDPTYTDVAANGYRVLITEMLQKVVTVTADSAEQARELVVEMYNNKETVLSDNDLYDYTIETLP